MKALSILQPICYISSTTFNNLFITLLFFIKKTEKPVGLCLRPQTKSVPLWTNSEERHSSFSCGYKITNFITKNE